MAIAVHEILAGLIPLRAPRNPPAREVVSHVTMARIAVRHPRPPPPPVVSHARVIAPVEAHVVAHAVSGAPARAEIVRRAGAARPKPPAFSNAKPVAVVPVGAQGAGAGTRSGAGSLGTGSQTGTGAGNSGNGSGAATGNQPCGFVDFSDPHGSRFDPNTHGFWVDIRISVHFPDGRSDSLMLDYPWYYANEASNPWSDQNLSNPDFPTTFQMPPSDQRSGEPPLVQYVIAHTGPDGYTLLKDCPAPQPR